MLKAARERNNKLRPNPKSLNCQKLNSRDASSLAANCRVRFFWILINFPVKITNARRVGNMPVGSLSGQPPPGNNRSAYLWMFAVNDVPLRTPAAGWVVLGQ